jgi:hypothetical protein
MLSAAKHPAAWGLGLDYIHISLSFFTAFSIHSHQPVILNVVKNLFTSACHSERSEESVHISLSFFTAFSIHSHQPVILNAVKNLFRAAKM